MWGTGSYYAMQRSMYQGQPPAVPGWPQEPVPGWGQNPYTAGPPRVGVGCAACTAGVGQTEGGGLTGGQWLLVLAVVAAGLYGTWWMLARYPDYRDALESSEDRTGAGAMERYRRKRVPEYDKIVDHYVNDLGWDRERAIKAVY